MSGAGSELRLGYAVCEALVALCAVLGNGLVILVFVKERKLRRRTNYYIVSLACADLLVGLLAIPLAVLASIGLPRNLHACLLTVSLLVVLCTISIFCLLGVSLDRYWAILHPMGYSRTVRASTAVGQCAARRLPSSKFELKIFYKKFYKIYHKNLRIICACWLAGALVGLLPLLGWNAGRQKPDQRCVFAEVMDYSYLVFLYFGTIVLPGLLIGAFYAHIHRVVLRQLRQISLGPGARSGRPASLLRLQLGAKRRRRELKATQNLSRIVLFFIVCWFPLYTINCVEAFCPRCRVSELLLDCCIILSHLNSAGNPMLYAYHLKDFRAALRAQIRLILCPGSATLHPQPAPAPAPKIVLRTSATPGNKSATISIIAGNNNNNNNNNSSTTADKISSNNKKSTAPVSILGCRTGRDAVSSSSNSSSSNSSPGHGARLGSNDFVAVADENRQDATSSIDSCQPRRVCEHGQSQFCVLASSDKCSLDQASSQ